MAGVWTLNWKAIKNVLLCGDAIEGLSALKDMNGNLMVTLTAAINEHTSRSVASPMGLMNGFFVRYGSGNTAPAESDYMLNTVLSGISALSTVYEKPVWDTATGVVSNTELVTIQNTNSAAVTVREWGITMRDPISGSLNRDYLVYRAVLDSPVTIQPNQSAMLTLTRSVTLTDPVVWPA